MVINRQKRVRVKVRELNAFCRRASRALGLPENSATICLVSDAQIASWNKNYRGKAKATDVLSFPALSNGQRRRRAPGRTLKFSATVRDPYLGDIAIAPAVARRNAREFQRSLDCEMRILTLHGLLHLMGYNHETDNGTMERVERRLRRKLGLR